MSKNRIAVTLTGDASSLIQAFHSGRLAATTFGSSLNDSLSLAQRASSDYEKSTTRIGSSLLSLTTIVKGAAAGFSAMQLVHWADDWGQYASRMKMATESTAEYEHAQNRMVASAQATFRSINETREAFINISPVLRDMGMSLDQSIDAVDAFSGLLVVAGADAQRGASAMSALERSLQSGKVSAQAWMSIYSSADGILDHLAETMGRSTTEVRRLGAEGKLTAIDLANALSSAYEPTMEKVAKMPTTVKDALTNLHSSFGGLIGNLNEGTGATSVLVEGVNLLASNLDLLAYAGGAVALVIGTRFAVAQMKGVAATVSSTNSVLANRLALLSLSAQISGTSRAAVIGYGAMATAARAASGAMALVGGPVGVAVLGLSAAAMYALSTQSAETKNQFDLMALSVDELRKKTEELTATQVKGLQASYLTEYEKAAQSADKSFKELLSSVSGLNLIRFDITNQELMEYVEKLQDARRKGDDLAPILDALREKAGVPFDSVKKWYEHNVAMYDSSKTADELREKMGVLEGSLGGVSRSALLASDSINGMSESDFTKLITNLETTLSVIGMTSQQAAEYRARLEGATDDQAQLAGVLAGMADAAKKMEKATQEKDAKAVKGAQALLDKLIEQEVQIRMNMTRTAEYAALMALGIEATIAAQGADTAAQLEGLKAQEEIVARINSITSNIGKNTASSLKKTGDSAKQLAREIDGLVGSLFPAVKAEADWIKQQKLLDEALKKGKVTQEQHAKGLAKIREQYELIVFEAPKHVKALQDEAKSLKDSLPDLRQRVDTFGLSAAAIARSAEAETRARIATLNNVKAVEVANGASKEYVKQIEQEIDALKDLLIQQEHQTGLLDKGERQEVEQKYYQDMADTAKRAHEEIERSLTDALMRGFESGKDFGKNFIDTLKNMFSSLVLRPIIQPIAAGAAGLVTGALGMGTANAQGAGDIDPITGLSTAKDMMGGLNWFTDFSGSMGNSLMDAGMYLQKFDGIVGDFGNTILGNIDTIANAANVAGAAWNYGKGIYDLTKGNYGAGIGAIGGQLIGGPIGGMIGNALGGMLDGAFKGETRHGAYMQYDLAAQQAVAKGGPSGGYGGQATIDAATQLFGSTVDTINAVLEGVGAQAQAAAFHGMFESSDKGRGGTFAGGSLQLADGSLVDFGTNQKGAGFGGKSGSAEEMFQNLQSEVHFAALEAWKAVGSEMPTMISDMLSSVDVRALSAEQAQAAVAEITGIVGSVNALTVALNQLPMLNLQELTFDAKASLNELFGGVDGFIGANTSYLQSFYSDAERHELAVKNLGTSLSNVGLEMPALIGSADELRALWRELVETQDLETAAGREAYATLMLTAGAFSEIADYAGEAAAGLTDMTDILRERDGLERQIMQLQGDTAGLRALELAALDESNHGLQEHIWFLQEEAEAAQRAAEIGRERYGLETQLLQLQGDTATLRARQLAGLDESNHALQEQIWALQDQSSAVQEAAKTQKSFWDSLVSGAQTAYNDLSVAISAERSAIQKEADRIAKSLSLSISAASDSVRSLDSLASQLSSTVSGMMKSGLDDARNRAWAQERVSRALSVATLTGVMPEGEDFEAALRLVAEPSEGLFNSFEDYQADFLRTAHEVDALRLLADDQLTVERRTLKTLEDQLAQSQGWRDAEMLRLDAQLDHWREQIDIASGTYRATLSVSAAVDGVQRAIASLHKSLAPESSLASYDTGISFVPHDMTANIHRGEIIIDPQSSNILRRYGIGVQGASGGSDSTEVKLLRQEIRELRGMLERKLTDIDQNTYDTARSNRQLSEQPQSVVVTNVVPTVNAVIGE